MCSHQLSLLSSLLPPLLTFTPLYILPPDSIQHSLLPLSLSLQITVLEEEQETVCQMYNLINMYSVPTPHEDLIDFATLKPSFNNLLSIIEEAAGEKHSSMKKFCASLHKDIKELNREVTEVKLKAQVFEEAY